MNVITVVAIGSLSHGQGDACPGCLRRGFSGTGCTRIQNGAARTDGAYGRSVSVYIALPVSDFLARSVGTPGRAGIAQAVAFRTEIVLEIDPRFRNADVSSVVGNQGFEQVLRDVVGHAVAMISRPDP